MGEEKEKESMIVRPGGEAPKRSIISGLTSGGTAKFGTGSSIPGQVMEERQSLVLDFSSATRSNSGNNYRPPSARNLSARSGGKRSARYKPSQPLYKSNRTESLRALDSGAPSRHHSGSLKALDSTLQHLTSSTGGVHHPRVGRWSRYHGVRELSFRTSQEELSALSEHRRAQVIRAQMRWRVLRVVFLTVSAFRGMLRLKELYGSAASGARPNEDGSAPGGVLPGGKNGGKMGSAGGRVILDPMGKLVGFWNLAVFLATLYNVVLAPVSACMHIGHGMAWPVILCNAISDVVMIADVFVKLRTGYYVEGSLVTDESLVRRRYMRTWLVPHVVAQLPADWIALWAGAGASVVGTLRTPRLLNLTRFPSYFDSWEAAINFSPIVLRFFKLGMWILLLAHLVGCIWYAIGRAELDNFPPEGWLVLDRGADETLWFLYLRSLYWATMTMTTVGYGDIRPVTDNEYVFAIVVMIIGQSIYAFIIGNMSTLIATADSLGAQFSKRVDMVTAYVRYRRIPATLAHRIMSFYDWLWVERHGVTEEEVLHELPGALRSEVTLFLIQTAIINTPLFAKCNKIFVNRLAILFKPVVAAPGDVVIVQGEVGFGMFIVLRGSLDVIETVAADPYEGIGDAPTYRSAAADSGTSEELVGLLTRGDVVGELSLVHPSRRSCSVRAREFTDLYFLHRADFALLLEEFPNTPLAIEETIGDALEERGAEFFNAGGY